MSPYSEKDWRRPATLLAYRLRQGEVHTVGRGRGGTAAVGQAGWAGPPGWAAAARDCHTAGNWYWQGCQELPAPLYQYLCMAIL